MSSNSEDDQQINSCRKTRKKRKSIIEDSESSSDQDPETCRTPQTTKSQTRRQSGGTRSSERIQKKQSRIFSMPKKEDVWKNIPSTPSPSKVLDKLKPRKIVNNFTKISHRYNHDPLYMDDEGSSLDEFIANDEEIYEDESDDESGDEDDGSIVDSGNESDNSTVPAKTKNQKKRIAGYRKRIQLETETSDDSSDTEDMETEERIVTNIDGKTASTKNINKQKRTKNDDDDDDNEGDDSGSNIVAKKRTPNRKAIKNSKISSAKKSKLSPQNRNDDSSDSDIVTPSRTRNRSIMESDDESDSCSNYRKCTVTTTADTTTKNQSLNDDDFSSDDMLEKLPLNQIIEDCNKDANDNVSKKDPSVSQHVNSTSVCKLGVVLNSDMNQSIKGADSHKIKDSNKSKVHVIESSDSNSESQDCVVVGIDDDEKSDSTAEDSNSGEECIESISSSEDTSEQSTSRSVLQQRKRNQEREKRFENFKEARKRLKTLKSPKDKEV